MSKIEYKTTEKHCQKEIDKWQNVCSRCGGKLIPIQTVDNGNNPTYWSGCDSCQIFDNGTKEGTYRIAVKMVDERNFRAYNFEQMPDKVKHPDEFHYWRKSQISGTVWVVSDILRIEKENEQRKAL